MFFDVKTLRGVRWFGMAIGMVDFGDVSVYLKRQMWACLLARRRVEIHHTRKNILRVTKASLVAIANRYNLLGLYGEHIGVDVIWVRPDNVSKVVAAFVVVEYCNKRAIQNLVDVKAKYRALVSVGLDGRRCVSEWKRVVNGGKVPVYHIVVQE